MTNNAANISNPNGSWLQSKVTWLFLLIIIIAVVVRIWSWDFVSIDYQVYVKNWVDYLRSHGTTSFKNNFYNYNPPYLYFLYLASLLPIPDLGVVKLVSLFFDLILAGGVGALVYHLRGQRTVGLIAAALVLVLPEEVLNSSVWGQVDAGYTAFVVWAVFFFLRNKQFWGWVFFATAVAFKAQALFLLPAILLIFILKRHNVGTLLVGLLVFLAWDLPCFIAGRSISSLALIYFTQVGTYRTLSSNAPNIYYYINNADYDIARNLGLLIGILIIVVVTVLLFRKQKKILSAGVNINLFILRTILAFAILTPFVLPQMHERYFYMAGIFAFVLVLLDKRYLMVAILIQIGNVLAYIPFLFGSLPQQAPYLQGTDYLIQVAIVPETLALVSAIYLAFKPVTSLTGIAFHRSLPAESRQ